MKDKTGLDFPEDEAQNEAPEVYAVHWQGGKAKISRRNLLKAGGVLVAGAALAGCASDGTSNWNCKKAFAHEHQISHLAITPDGGWALSNAKDEPFLKLWTFPDGEKMKILETSAPVSSFVISPEGDVVYSADQSGEVVVWSLPGAERVNQFNVPDSLGEPSWLYLSPSGQFLAIAGQSTVFAIYSVPDGALQHTLEHEDAPQLLLEYSPNSRYLASYVPGKTGYDANVWSLDDGELLISQNNFEEFKPLFSPDSKYCVYPDYDKIMIYSLLGGVRSRSIQENQHEVTALVINFETGELITGDSLGNVKIWSMPDGDEKYSWDSTHSDMSHFLLAEGENLIAIVWKTYDGETRVSLYSLYDGSEISTLEIEYPSALAEFSPNGKYLTIIESDGDRVSKVRTHVVESEKILIDQIIYGNAKPAFSPDSRHLLIGDGLGKMNVYSLEDGKVVACIVDLAASGEDAEGREYSIDVEGENVTYTLPCGSPLPAGAVCTCDCVSGSGCACVGHTTCSCVGDVCSCVSHSGGSHYWYPN